MGKKYQDCAWDISTARGLVVINVDALELQIRIAVIGSSWVNSVLVRDHFPELSADLVSALSCLDVDDLSHLVAAVAVRFG